MTPIRSLMARRSSSSGEKQEHGPTRGRDFVEELEDGLGGGEIESVGRFVADQKTRIAGEFARQQEALDIAAGEGGDSGYWRSPVRISNSSIRRSAFCFDRGAVEPETARKGEPWPPVSNQVVGDRHRRHRPFAESVIGDVGDPRFPGDSGTAGWSGRYHRG